MSKTISFRLDDDKLQFLDQLAKSADRDRTYLINEAVEAYLELKRWHIAEIEKAVADADAGKFVPPEEVEAFFRMAREQL
jgi:predicted transcriptional regulator